MLELHSRGVWVWARVRLMQASADLKSGRTWLCHAMHRAWKTSCPYHSMCRRPRAHPNTRILPKDFLESPLSCALGPKCRILCLCIVFVAPTVPELCQGIGEFPPCGGRGSRTSENAPHLMELLACSWGRECRQFGCTFILDITQSYSTYIYI